jgi:hypothetical protein
MSININVYFCFMEKCKFCGKEFQERSKKRYCSTTCRVKDFNKRHITAEVLGDLKAANKGLDTKLEEMFLMLDDPKKREKAYVLWERLKYEYPDMDGKTVIWWDTTLQYVKTQEQAGKRCRFFDFTK